MRDAWDVMAAHDAARDRASIARGVKRARLRTELRRINYRIILQKLRALEDIDNIALTLGEGK
jgi:hypothetical protein